LVVRLPGAVGSLFPEIRAVLVRMLVIAIDLSSLDYDYEHRFAEHDHDGDSETRFAQIRRVTT
jgi:hypothetical protein